jgi:hypothetical protein
MRPLRELLDASRGVIPLGDISRPCRETIKSADHRQYAVCLNRSLVQRRVQARDILPRHLAGVHPGQGGLDDALKAPRYHAAVEALRFASACSARNASITSPSGKERRSLALSAAGSSPCA